jgi:hypothetical protein
MNQMEDQDEVPEVALTGNLHLNFHHRKAAVRHVQQVTDEADLHHNHTS